MVFSLLAYFLSMVTAFVVVMGALIGFGDSQLRASRVTHTTAVSVLAGSERDALTNSEKVREEQKAAEARKVLEAQRAAEAKAAEAKKIARAKLARERRQAMAARQRQERENALAFGYQSQFSNGAGAGLYSYAPRY
jgi:flagellar biosynthesis GTPase FlhF